MIPPIHPASGLLKATWTPSDYPAMQLRGCMIHAINIGQHEDNRVQIIGGEVNTEMDDLDDEVRWDLMFLDIDYIVSRPEPTSPGRERTYWVAPATLAFTWVGSIFGRFGTDASPPARLGLGTITTPLVITDVQHVTRRPFHAPMILKEGMTFFSAS